MNLNKIQSDEWQAIRGAGSPKTPQENLSLCAEVFIEHERFDEASTIKSAGGVMVDRHIWPGRTIKPFQSPGRDYPGEDEVATGAYISLAARERGEDGLGGELYAGKWEGKERPAGELTAHQREWDYLAGHVAAAFAIYQNKISPWPCAELNDWQKVEALARYAMNWKMRTSSTYASFHPVDVLFHSSYCSGAAAVLQALAMVAGFETRFICISYHSTIEIRVNGRWIWADNIWANGGVTPSTFNYAEMTADPFAIPSFTDGQRKAYSARVARYRSPWHYAGSMYWHFCPGDGKGRGRRNDVTDGYGLSVPYDPSTAAALYPEMKHHSFFSPKDWQPTVNLSEKGALVRSVFELTPDAALRKVFFIGESKDNPITGGVVKLRVAEKCDANGLECWLDGRPLRCLGEGVRFEEPTVDFELPVPALTPGTHELHISTKENSARVILYPDIVEPYYPPHWGSAVTVADETFRVEPIALRLPEDEPNEPLRGINKGATS